MATQSEIIRQLARDLKARLKSGELEVRQAVDRLRQAVVLAVVENGPLRLVDADVVMQAVSGAKAEFETRLKDLMSEDGRRVFVRGIKAVDAVAKGAGVQVALPYVDEKILDQLKQYRAELVTGLAAQVHKDVASEIALGVLGQKSQAEIVAAIGRKLPSASIFGSVEERARVIYTTEVARIHSLAEQMRMEQLAKQLPDVSKRWVHSHLGAPRPNHLALDGVEVKATDAFVLKGRDGMTYRVFGPHDPRLPAGEVINCRCMLVPVMERFRRTLPYRVERYYAKRKGPGSTTPPVPPVPPVPPPAPPPEPARAKPKKPTEDELLDEMNAAMQAKLQDYTAGKFDKEVFIGVNPGDPKKWYWGFGDSKRAFDSAQAQRINRALEPGNVWTHFHPGQSNVTFSTADLKCAVGWESAAACVVTGKKTFVMYRPATGWPSVITEVVSARAAAIRATKLQALNFETFRKSTGKQAYKDYVLWLNQLYYDIYNKKIAELCKRLGIRYVETEGNPWPK